jgi:hypothetical protein
MKRIECPKCSRIIEIESVIFVTVTDKDGHAHATVVNGEIQCACGKYL